jgi:single-strand selective monofunctional uracil DNA glycosylase
MELERITRQLVKELQSLSFDPPVALCYNPLEYAGKPYRQYLKRFGNPPKEIVLVGMNPGPWGMAQTGIPFGDIHDVREWMAIQAPVGRPQRLHPARPVLGFACHRNEVSGQRLWGWARERFGTPEAFFRRFFVANYCPLMFIAQNGANLTPDKLRAQEARPLFAACDRALRRTVEWLAPAFVVGVGRFAAGRARIALAGLKPTIGAITHPSPANPKANRGWSAIVRRELNALGIEV